MQQRTMQFIDRASLAASEISFTELNPRTRRIPIYKQIDISTIFYCAAG
jgi:hypothetical protein